MWNWIILAVVGVIVIGLLVGLILVIKWCGRRVRDERKRVDGELNRIREAEKVRLEMAQRQQDAEQGAIKTFEERVAELETAIDRKKIELKDWGDEIAAKQSEFEGWEEKIGRLVLFYASTNETLNRMSQELHEIDAGKHDIEKEKMLLEEMKKTLNNEIAELQRLVKDLQQRKRLAILNQDESQDGLWDIDISPAEEKLIRLLEQIKSDYPELSIDIATIEWRKIWLPKFQELGSREGLKGMKGIYRLVLKKDEDISYVGQAVDIQTRWYEHVKKMIGADPSKGGEKLYRYRPEELYWSVVEVNPKDLDESERYWIDFFGCKERGLNKK